MPVVIRLRLLRDPDPTSGRRSRPKLLPTQRLHSFHIRPWHPGFLQIDHVNGPVDRAPIQITTSSEMCFNGASISLADGRLSLIDAPRNQHLVRRAKQE